LVYFPVLECLDKDKSGKLVLDEFYFGFVQKSLKKRLAFLDTVTPRWKLTWTFTKPHFRSFGEYKKWQMVIVKRKCRRKYCSRGRFLTAWGLNLGMNFAPIQGWTLNCIGHCKTKTWANVLLWNRRFLISWGLPPRDEFGPRRELCILVVTLVPRGELCILGVNLDPRDELGILGRDVHPFVHPKGEHSLLVTQTEGLTGGLGNNFTSKGQVHPWGQLNLWGHP
jgi:hypothetical protein